MSAVTQHHLFCVTCSVGCCEANLSPPLHRWEPEFKAVLDRICAERHTAALERTEPGHVTVLNIPLDAKVTCPCHACGCAVQILCGDVLPKLCNACHHKGR